MKPFGRIFSDDAEIFLDEALQFYATNPSFVEVAESLNLSLAIQNPSEGEGDPGTVYLLRGAELLGWEYEILVPIKPIPPGTIL